MTQVFSIKERSLCTVAVAVSLLVVGCGGGGSGENAGNASSAGNTAGNTNGAGKTTTGEGSGSGESTSAGGKAAGQAAPLSKAQFIQRADAICKKDLSEYSRKAFAYIEANNLQSASKSEQRAALTEIVHSILIPNLERQIARIRALPAPEGDEAEVASILAAMEKEIAKGAHEAPRLLNSATPLGEATKSAEAYGFTACGGA